jgi:hypothetical protein
LVERNMRAFEPCPRCGRVYEPPEEPPERLQRIARAESRPTNTYPIMFIAAASFFAIAAIIDAGWAGARDGDDRRWMWIFLAGGVFSVGAIVVRWIGGRFSRVPERHDP